MIPLVLAIVHYDNPVLWAVFIGWVLSVVLHEWAHGIVAYFGGDHTIRDRGGLTLNPLQYVDPIFSIVMPAVVFIMGGVPLPGGVTFVRKDLLRSAGWESAVSLAGPGMNFLLFLLLVLPFHPTIGWLDARSYATFAVDPPTAYLFMATLAKLQLLAVVLNLVPVPPLDGFQAIAPRMNPETRRKLETPPLSTMLFLGYFLLIWQVPAVVQTFYKLDMWILETALRFDPQTIEFFRKAYNDTLFGKPG